MFLIVFLILKLNLNSAIYNNNVIFINNSNTFFYACEKEGNILVGKANISKGKINFENTKKLDNVWRIRLINVDNNYLYVSQSNYEDNEKYAKDYFTLYNYNLDIVKTIYHKSIYISPKGNYVIDNNKDRLDVYKFNNEYYNLIYYINKKTAGYSNLVEPSFSKDENYFAIGYTPKNSKINIIEIRKLNDGKIFKKVKTDKTIRNILFSSNNVIFSKGRGMVIVELKKGDVKEYSDFMPYEIEKIDVSKDGSIVLFYDSFYNLKIYNILTKKVLFSKKLEDDKYNFYLSGTGHYVLFQDNCSFKSYAF